MSHAASDDRFGFGENWARFLRTVGDERIAEAERSLSGYLGISRLDGLRFLDVGCGSGLFSLAARRLGASVHSFDADRDSVGCALELKRRYRPDDPAWTIEPGSVLDEGYMSRLGEHDIVYSWGVLHHTGDLRRAMANVVPCVGSGGALFIAIYNDQGMWSRIWTQVKRTYNRLPPWLRTPYVIAVMAPREAAFALLGWRSYLRSWREYGKNRGMSRWHDLVDWVGGYPFEVAKPEVVFDFYKQLGFTLEKLFTCAGGLGCNQYVFRRTGGRASTRP